MSVFPLAILISFNVSQRIPQGLYKYSDYSWHSIIAAIFEISLHDQKNKREHKNVHHKYCEEWNQIVEYLYKHLNQETITFIVPNIL